MSRRRPWPRRAVDLLACPLCAAPVEALPGDVGVRCPSGHLYDRARQGHVTLLPPGHVPPSGDSAAMVADRMAFLDAGHYRGITRVLAGTVLAGTVPAGQSAPAGDGDPPATLLDLGGGTGHHLAGVLDRVPEAVGVVLDSSRYAARRAAAAHPRALAVVGDTWARLPVRDGCVDRVLVVFAPRNGPETARVLRPGGRLVVVTPAADHLAELVGPLGLLRVDPDKARRLVAGLEPHLRPVGVRAHRERLLLDRAAVTTLVGMGPHARHLSAQGLAAAVARLPARTPVTVSVELGTWSRTG